MRIRKRRDFADRGGCALTTPRAGLAHRLLAPLLSADAIRHIAPAVAAVSNAASATGTRLRRVTALRARSGYQWVVSFVAQRARCRGTSASDLDRIAERYRAAMWAALAFAALSWLALGWSVAVWALGVAMLAAAATTVIWRIAVVLEEDDRSITDL